MKRLLPIFLTLLLLASCHEQSTLVPEVPTGDPVPSDMEIRFDAEADRTSSLTTRGVLIGNTDAHEPNDDDGQQPWTTPWVDGDEFTAFGLYYFDNMTILGQQYMYGQQVKYVPGVPSGEWTYEPLKYWPQQGYLDLFAHYPSAEMFEKLRLMGDHTTDPGLTLPDDMPEDDFVDPPSSSPARRRGPGGMARRAPVGLSSLRFWHENPLDTTISFRYYCLPSGLEAPAETDEPVENDVPMTEYDDARYQPDLMFSHRPHLGKMATSAKVFMNFTHAMMGVRFWISSESTFKNLGDFTINNVSFGPVYSGGECIAYDNTDWAKYYSGLNEATQFSEEPVKLRYVWNYGTESPRYNADGQLDNDGAYTMGPAYGGCEYRIPSPGGIGLPGTRPQPIDKNYPVETETDTYTQRCDLSLTELGGDYGTYSTDAAQADEGWHPTAHVPVLPVLDNGRGVGAEQSAFIFPPQIFMHGKPYIRVTFTLAEIVDGDETPGTQTITSAFVPISNIDDICVEDGEILDIYFRFDIDGYDYFDFKIDAKICPWKYGGQLEDRWTNW